MRSRRPFWDPASVDAFAMTFPARVRVIAGDGSERVAECARPRGGAGNTVEGPEPVSRAKLAAYGPWLWGEIGKALIADDGVIREEGLRLQQVLTQRYGKQFPPCAF